MTQPRDGVDRIVEQWAQELPELDTTAMAVFGRVYRLARLSGDAVEQVYGGFGLGRPEFDVLATLRRSGPPYALSPGSLAASMMLSSGGTTARIDRLVRAGLVTRSTDPGDRRGVVVQLTDDGRRLVEGAVAAGVERQQRLLGHLSEGDRRRLAALLRAALLPLDPAPERDGGADPPG